MRMQLRRCGIVMKSLRRCWNSIEESDISVRSRFRESDKLDGAELEEDGACLISSSFRKEHAESEEDDINSKQPTEVRIFINVL